MIAAVAVTVAAAALVGAVEYARIRVVRARFVRAVHATPLAVPSGAVPPPSIGVTVAAPHPTPASRAGGGRERQLTSVSPMVSRHAPTTNATGTSAVVGAQLGPAGVPQPPNPRPGHHGGAA